jgi:hypothetical protein
VTLAEGCAEAVPVVLPVNDTTPLALRGRFKEQMPLEFVSEVLRSIERQLAARDDHGRPLLISKETKLIADTASARIASLVAKLDRVTASGLRFASSPILRVLVAAGSQHVIQHAIEKCEAKQPEKFLPLDALDELLQSTSRTLLEGAMAQPELATALSGMIALDEALAGTIEHASADLLQCGSDRRTIVVVPKDQLQSPVVEKLRAQRPEAAIVAADVDDVFVVSEESGVSPRSFALGLERVFPGIADAARRLLTRIDIEWKSLV